MTKAETVFQKLSKCKSKSKKIMTKKASLLGAAAKMAPWMVPTPRKTAINITDELGKNVKMKKLVNLPK